MDYSTIALLVALAVGFGIAAAFEVMRRRALRPYWSRSCQGRAWMRAFPEATAAELRTFLHVLATSFGFRPAQGLSFSPADALLNIYRACYPVEGWPDSLELETFDRAVEVRYGINLTAVWSKTLTLGEVFGMRPNNPLQPTAGGRRGVDSPGACARRG